MTNPDEMGTGISDERKKEIAVAFEQLLDQGQDSENAGKILCSKYSIDKETLNRVLQEHEERYAAHSEDDEDDEFEDVEDDEDEHKKDEQPGD